MHIKRWGRGRARWESVMYTRPDGVCSSVAEGCVHVHTSFLAPRNTLVSNNRLYLGHRSSPHTLRSRAFRRHKLSKCLPVAMSD